MGRAIRALGDDHQAALSVGISLQTIWVLVWFIAGIIALATGIVWGARAGVSFALEVIAYKALAGADAGRAGIDHRGHRRRDRHRSFWKSCSRSTGASRFWAAIPRPGSPIVLALVVLLFRPQGLFGEKIIERV